MLSSLVAILSVVHLSTIFKPTSWFNVFTLLVGTPQSPALTWLSLALSAYFYDEVVMTEYIVPAWSSHTFHMPVSLSCSLIIPVLSISIFYCHTFNHFHIPWFPNISNLKKLHSSSSPYIAYVHQSSQVVIQAIWN